MGLRAFYNKVVIKYTNLKSSIKNTIHNVLLTILHALSWIETKLASFKNWIIRGIDHISDFVENVHKAVAVLVETYRINKTVKLQKKLEKVKSKIGYL